MANVTNIPAPRVAFIDERTGLMSREWYRFFLNLFNLTGSGTNTITLDDLQVSPNSEAISAKYDEAIKALEGLQLSPVAIRDDVLAALIDSALYMRAPMPFIPEYDYAPAAFTANDSFTQGRTFRQKRTAITINSAASDVATFENLPSKYMVTRFAVYDASADLTASAATIGLYTAASAGGDEIATLSTIQALTASGMVLNMTIPTASGIYDDAKYYTAPSLYVYNGTAHGSAATITAQLEIIDLS